MNLSFVRKHRFHVVVGAAALAMVLVAVLGDLAVASNMGFKMNKQIVKGTNLVALPFRTQTTTAQQLCAVFGKTTSATSLAQFTGSALQSYTCDQLTAGFPLLNKGVGVRIVESVSAATGILVGSHIPDIAEPARGLAYDVVELNYQRACVGRAYFKIPGGIQYGQHFLNVQFAGSTVNVPFKIMTKDELKENKAKWEELQKQLKEQQKTQG